MWYVYGMAVTVVIKLINTIIVLKHKFNDLDEFCDSIDNKTLLTTILPISLLSIALWPLTLIYMPFGLRYLLSSNDDE